MKLSICSFASGSSGNCYLIRSGKSAVLIDAGISSKKITGFLKKTGVPEEMVHGIFVTHEHTDHTKGLRVASRKNPDWKVYASSGTGACIREQIHREDQLVCFETGSAVQIRDMEVRSIRTSHDAADPVCYTVASGGARLTILTDTGYVPAEAADYLCRSDIVILEANHEVNMLKAGPYPYNLKRRILGERGHLSNEDAGRALVEMMQRDGRYRQIFLAHLSSKNNFPGLALQTIKNILEENSFYMEKDYRLEVMLRDGISGMAEV